jgi:LmbE family N-acetylglucosaminyl deacetylase
VLSVILLLPLFLGQTFAPAQDAAKPTRVATTSAAANQAQTVQLSHSTPVPITAEPSREEQLREVLQQLTTTGRILQVVAHPDDEDGGLLTLEARVDGETAMLFTLTRGEGGQNAEGAVFFDELGILRTEELLAADKIYGADERFSHVADFGFSKTPQESFAKWGGEGVPLADLVRQIRLFQPDVLVSRFGGTPRDGHGHHQAAALLTREAFAVAAEPQRLNAGAAPVWQPAKLYMGNVGDAATLHLDLNQASPLLDGKTPADIAWEGLRHHLSQGAGNWHFNHSREYANYQLAATSPGVAASAHETSMFAGIDTTLPGLANRFPSEAGKIPHLKETLTRVAALVSQAQTAAQKSPDGAIASLAEASALLQAISPYSPQRPPIAPLALRLWEKRTQLNSALQLAAGLEIKLVRVPPNAGSAFLIPGENAQVKLTVTNRGGQRIDLRAGPINSNAGPTSLKLPASLAAGESKEIVFAVDVQKDALPVRAPFHRDSPVKDTVYQVDDPGSFDQSGVPDGLALFIPWQISSIDGSTKVRAPLFIAPPISIRTEPAALLLRREAVHSADIQVLVRNNSQSSRQGSVSLTLPAGWVCKPSQASVQLAAGASETVPFSVSWPAENPQSQILIKAGFQSSGKIYSYGYEMVARADLEGFPYYAPAQTSVSLVDASIPGNTSIGYIMGVGDTIPESLSTLGFHVTLLTARDLASGSLTPYGAIVTGIRAYATRPDLRDHNARLLDYVKNGGTLIVQYEQDTEGFNRGHFTPYPAVLGNQRVSQEEQPVEILEPNADLFRYPNRITAADFNGWVQERGLYFMKEWSTEYQPLLSCHDTGEPPQLGGLVEASYGKGIYIYTALAFFRQLPNGVPGAARLFVNLLGAGHDPATQPVVSADSKARDSLISGSQPR